MTFFFGLPTFFFGFSCIVDDASFWKLWCSTCGKLDTLVGVICDLLYCDALFSSILCCDGSAYLARNGLVLFLEPFGRPLGFTSTTLGGFVLGGGGGEGGRAGVTKRCFGGRPRLRCGFTTAIGTLRTGNPCCPGNGYWSLLPGKFIVLVVIVIVAADVLSL